MRLQLLAVCDVFPEYQEIANFPGQLALLAEHCNCIAKFSYYHDYAKFSYYHDYVICRLSCVTLVYCDRTTAGGQDHTDFSRLSWSASATNALRRLHWLLIGQNVVFRTATITFRARQQKDSRRIFAVNFGIPSDTGFVFEFCSNTTATTCQQCLSFACIFSCSTSCLEFIGC